MKTALVTGANAGLGKECCRQLSEIESVNKIYMACRNAERATEAKEYLEKITGKSCFEIVVMDTSNLDSVRKAVENVDPIDALVLNAGGALAVDTLTSDGVTTSFAANLLGHVVFVESLLKAGKLSGSVVYAGSEGARGVPEMGLNYIPLPESTVDQFKTVADGSFIKTIKSRDHKLDSYALIKYMAALWMSTMARRHDDIRFITVSPGATQGTDAVKNVPKLQAVFFTVAMKVMSFIGRAHGVDTGAKRYVDVLLDETTYKSGRFYGSVKGVSGPMGDQAELYVSDLADTQIQDNAAQAIHDILEGKDFENKFKE